MKNLLLTLLLFSLPLASPAQQTAPVTTLATLNDLLAKVPRANETIAVRTGYNGQDWGGERLFTHFPTNIAALTTNVAHIFAVATNTYSVGGQWRSADRTNLVQDARWWRVVGDGVTSDTTNLQVAADWTGSLAATNATLLLPARSYYVPDGIDIPNVRLSAKGATLIPDGTNYAWRAQGSIGLYQYLTASALKGSSNIVCAALASNVTVGSFIKITATNNFSASDPNRPVGEMVQVAAVSSPTITLAGPLLDSYTTNNFAAAAIVTTIFVDDGGVTVAAPAYNASTAPTPLGAYISYANRPVITGAYINCNEAGIRIFDCFSPQILNAQVVNSFRTGGGNGDALFIGNATMYATVIGGTFQGNRAGIDLGGNSLGGVPWEVKISGANLSNHPDSTQNAGTEHASVGSVTWENCTVTGSGSSQRGIGVAARRSTINNLTAIGVPYAVYDGSAYATTATLSVNGVTMVNPVAAGNAVYVSGTYSELLLDRIEGSYGGGVGLLVAATAVINNWKLSNFNTTNGVGVLVLNGATTPSRFELYNSSFGFPTQNTTSYGVRFLDPDVTSVLLLGVTQDKTAGLLYMDGSATNADITTIAVTSKSPDSHHIISDAALASVYLADSYFGNPAAAASILSVSDVAKIGLIGVRSEGANMTKVVNGNISGRAFDSGNSLHITLPGAWASGTTASYAIPLASDGAVPFALTIDTTATDNTTSVRAITSGKASFYVGGRNTTTSTYTYGGGGGNLTLQNLATNIGNFTQIANLDATGGQYNSGLAFVNNSHANDGGSIHFLTRNGGAQPVDVGRWETNGVLYADYGAALVAATNVPTHVLISAASPTSTAQQVYSITPANLANAMGIAGMAYISDAPSDGFGYVRSNAAWARQSSGSGTNLDNLTVTNTVRFGGNFSIANGIGGTDRFTLTGSGISTFMQLNVFGDTLISSGANVYSSATNNWFYNGLNQYWPSSSDRVWVSSVGVKGAVPLRGLNLLDSSTIDWAITGSTNVAPAIKSASISTNLIDSTFYTLLMATNGTGGGSTATNYLDRTLFYSRGQVVIGTTNALQSLVTDIPAHLSKTIAAGSITTNFALHVTAAGTLTSTNANWSNNKFTVKVGGLSIIHTITDDTSGVSLTDAPWDIDCYLTVTATGTNATVYAASVLRFRYDDGGVVTYPWVFTFPGIVSGTLDTTGSVTVDVLYSMDTGGQEINVKCNSVVATVQGAEVLTSGGGAAFNASLVSVNGATNNYNFNDTTPTAPTGYELVTAQASGTNVSFYVPKRKIFTTTAVAVVGTSSSTQVWTNQIPAGLLSAGDVLRFSQSLVWTNGTGSTASFTPRFFFGTNDVADSLPATAISSTTPSSGSASFVVDVVATNSWNVRVTMERGSPGTLGPIVGDLGTASAFYTWVGTNIVVDPTAGIPIAFWIQPSTSDSRFGVTAHQGTLLRN